MKENPESARDTSKTIQWKRILKVRGYKRNNPVKENPKSARDTNVTSNEKVPKITRDTNITIQWKRMLKVREMLM